MSESVYGMERRLDAFELEVATLTVDNARMQKALEFYADEDRYEDGVIGNVVETGPDTDEFEPDNGYVARAALPKPEEGSTDD